MNAKEEAKKVEATSSITDRFATKARLNVHVKKQHLEGQQLFCDKCEYKTSYDHLLKKHRKVKHEGFCLKF